MEIVINDAEWEAFQQLIDWVEGENTDDLIELARRLEAMRLETDPQEYLERDLQEYFVGAILREANFEGKILGSINLQNADLRGANFGGTTLRGVSFEKADLRRANFKGATLCNVNLRGAKLDEVSWKGVKLDKATLQSFGRYLIPRYDFSSQHYLLDPELRDLFLQNLDELNLEGADLRDVDFSNFILVNVNLQNANLQGVNFSNSILISINLDGADLDGAILESSVLDNIQWIASQEELDRLRDLERENIALELFFQSLLLLSYSSEFLYLVPKHPLISNKHELLVDQFLSVLNQYQNEEQLSSDNEFKAICWLLCGCRVLLEEIKDKDYIMSLLLQYMNHVDIIDPFTQESNDQQYNQPISYRLSLQHEKAPAVQLHRLKNLQRENEIFKGHLKNLCPRISTLRPNSYDQNTIFSYSRYRDFMAKIILTLREDYRELSVLKEIKEMAEEISQRFVEENVPKNFSALTSNEQESKPMSNLEDLESDLNNNRGMWTR